MKINIELNRKSVEQAKRQFIYVKKILPKMQKDFLEDVAMWLINKANTHLNNSDIGENVKIDIRNGWEYDFTSTGIKITNRTEQAVFVEFGVGVVGQGNAHPQASVEGYEYNLPSPYKYAGKYHDDDTWRFTKQSTQDVDLPKDSYETWTMGSGALKIITRGAKGVWYAYNAIVDAQMELAKANGGEIGALWETIKRKYIN
jgi:hypothetical protein